MEMPDSEALRRMERIRAYVYWMNGPVFPLKSMLSAGLNNMFFRASTFNIKYFKAPKPTIRAISLASSSLKSVSLLILSSDILRALLIISATRSSASTTVPSRLFILPLGSSTMPYEKCTRSFPHSKPSLSNKMESTWKW